MSELVSLTLELIVLPAAVVTFISITVPSSIPFALTAFKNPGNFG